jgi:hypothetical protein
MNFISPERAALPDDAARSYALSGLVFRGYFVFQVFALGYRVRAFQARKSNGNANVSIIRSRGA